MMFFWKRILIVIVCFVLIVFFVFFLKILGVFKEMNMFMGYNFIIYICRFLDGFIFGMFVYFVILFLVMLGNFVVIVGFYIFVLKRINLLFSFKSKIYEIYYENNFFL